MTSPRQTFLSNIRPAELLLQVYSLLDTNDRFMDQKQMIEVLRPIVKADKSEDLLVVYNEIFLGLIREEAKITPSTLRRSTLCHLLRQAVVASCTGLDTYLPALLKANLPVVIRALKRDFMPRDDKVVNDKFKGMTFSLDDMVRVMTDTESAPEHLSNKLMGYINFSYLSSSKGVHVVGRLLGLQQPWKQIAEQLKRAPEELEKIVDDATNRRNDIVHRADRSQKDTEGEAQEITYHWTMQAVDTIRLVCLTLDELVIDNIKEYQQVLEQA
jgi:hypothetical protein